MLNVKPTPRQRKFDSAAHLIYVHIGKCGGASLWNAIQRSERLASTFDKVSKTHVEKPPVHQLSRYLIVVRDPIQRAISAFNWRYRLVVSDGTQTDRFAGEYDVLNRYKTLDTLAASLYTADRLDIAAARDFRAIHHLREDIAFYLEGLLEIIRPEQIYGVLRTETLAQDTQRVLGVASLPSVHENRSVTPPEQKHLSDQSLHNLRRFLASDFAAVDRLAALSPPITVKDKEFT